DGTGAVINRDFFDKDDVKTGFAQLCFIKRVTQHRSDAACRYHNALALFQTRLHGRGESGRNHFRDLPCYNESCYARAFQGVSASVISTRNRMTKVMPRSTRSCSFIGNARLNEQEPTLTVIAPTTPMA